MSALLERLGVELPVVQAGMGPISRHELAAAVSEAGGLGTIGTLDADAMEREIEAARRLTGRPVAVNLLLPFTRARHWQAASSADAVVTFWGKPLRRTGAVWLHQCGSIEEALAAHSARADGVILQGREAGGHVRGETRAFELLENVRRALPDDYPVLLAGGVASGGDVRTALDAGADAAVLGTRFLMSEESRAHPAYKERLVAARDTVLTELFGGGWAAAPHRVLWNAAAERWLTHGTAPAPGPALARAVNRLTSPLISRVPMARVGTLARMQRAGVPFFGPFPPTDDGPASLVDAGALYAGETVARIDDVRPAAALVEELAPA